MKLARHEDAPEIFLSLQGEGKNQGTPSVFVRTSRCNLYCSWCDTPYTWNWHGSSFEHVEAARFDRDQSTLELDPREAAERVRRFACQRVVLTGGEPLLQAAECASLARALREFDARYVFEVETNGTLVPSVELDALVEQYTVSPKLEHAGIERSLRLRDAPLSYFAANPKSVFKFVVRDRADTTQVEELAQSYGIEPGRIYLMPLGTTSSVLKARSPDVAGACLDHGYRFSDRLHIHLFGNRPGV